MRDSLYQGRPVPEDRVGDMEKGEYFYGTFRDGQSEKSADQERSFGVRVMMSIAALILLSLGYSVTGKPVPTTTPDQSSCNTVDGGYQCFSNVSHLWGQYSPYFAVESQSGLSGDVPSECQITFANLLSRHGARYPTASKSYKYSSLIKDIQKNATSFPDKYAFLETYEYNLGEDDLTPFGENQLVNSGIKFYNRYENLTRNIVPFIRASGSDRVIASGEKFIEGFQSAKTQDPHAKNQTTPTVNVVIAEGSQYNNTLDHSICTSFENNDDFEDQVADNFTTLITPSIRKRLEADLPGTSLSDSNIIYLMDMCAFDTVARTADGSSLSPFCNIFTAEEWRQYNYLNSLKKYYGYGAGNPLGPAQGIGYTNELIARLTQTPVHDHTSTNRTLDSNPNTFPLNRNLYADFGHDNGMVSIFFALGLYNSTQDLLQDTIESARDAGGYSASWAVPFAARAYIEMMQCGSAETEPLVRVLVNDRVVPLHGCKTDELGRCPRDEFVRGLGYARSGGNWGSCFK
ncbi:3-phytase A [Aspergillus cristatus]|uniref:Phytase A n=1 Tax=Aspergillus cristatus TaxID=573508 RepID=A0A1E3BQR5_ASPCR|nr:3-phytase A [Aspergillus cristatus]